MKKLNEEIVRFFKRQGFVIVSSVDKNGSLHSSCKGIVKIDESGFIYLLDLYKGKTYANLRRNANITLTAVDEHKFKGYCLKGEVRQIERDDIDVSLIKAWEERLTTRITQRLIKNIHGEKGHLKHPESILPKPKYLILVEVEKVVNLTPQHIK